MEAAALEHAVGTIRIAADDAEFGMPEVRIGAPTIVGAMRLPRRVGMQHALAEAFTEPESLRVELTPYSGQALVFAPGDDGRPGSLTYNGATFVRLR